MTLAGDEQVVWLQIAVNDGLQEQSHVDLPALLPWDDRGPKKKKTFHACTELIVKQCVTSAKAARET